MSKFVFKVVFFIILPFGIMSLFFQTFIDDELKKSNLSNYKEWNDIIDSRINADLIIQGSSRAWVHISPYVIDSVFSINSYNLGIDGYEFLMQYYRFILYIKHNKKPQYIIQCVDHSTLAKRNDLFMIEQFIPYLRNDIIKQAVKHYKGFGKNDFIIPFLKYTHTFYTKELMLESLYTNSLTNSSKFKGFQAQNRKWDSTFSDFKNLNPLGYRDSINNLTQIYFEKFLFFCNKENIKVIFVYTPEYLEAQNLLLNRDSITNVFRCYVSTYNIPFLDYSNDSICMDTTNFYNSQHLNAIGVKKFNFRLANDLKKIIK